MLTENPSRYSIEKGNREFRKDQKKMTLEQLDAFFDPEYIKGLLIEKLADSLNPNDIDPNLHEKKPFPGGIIVSNDNISQILIGKGYKRLWKSEQYESLDKGIYSISD